MEVRWIHESSLLMRRNQVSLSNLQEGEALEAAERVEEEVEVAVVGGVMVVEGQVELEGEKNIVEVPHHLEGVAALVEVAQEAVGEVDLEEAAAVVGEVVLGVVAVGAEEERTVKWQKLIRSSAYLVLFQRWIFSALSHPDQRSVFARLICRKLPCRCLRSHHGDCRHPSVPPCQPRTWSERTVSRSIQIICPHRCSNTRFTFSR